MPGDQVPHRDLSPPRSLHGGLKSNGSPLRRNGSTGRTPTSSSSAPLSRASSTTTADERAPSAELDSLSVGQRQRQLTGDSVSCQDVALRTPGSTSSESVEDLESEKGKSTSSSVWDTTNKVLGVNTVLGTAGLASAPIALPSLGTGVVGGCAAAAMGVATAASLVTGVGVIAGMGVAGVKYAKAKKDEHRKKKEEEEQASRASSQTELARQESLEAPPESKDDTEED